MATIVTRSGKGSPLTNTEVDANFTNLNTELGTKANTASLATVATSGAYADLTGKPTNVSSFSNDSGYITGITSSNVTTALGYTPYNATNPSGYITSAALTPYALKTGAAFTGAISSTGSVTAPLFSATSSGAGSVYLNSGTASNTGYISFWNAAGVRQSFIGYSTANNNLIFQAEGSTGFSFNKTVAVTGGVTSSVGVHAPIFYDSDNTAFYADLANTNLSLNVAGYIEAANVSTNTQPALGVTRVGGYGLIGNRAVWYLTNGGGEIQIGNGATHNASPSMTVSATAVTSLRDFYAPIFYDSSNTTYYVDPAATGTAINVAGKIYGVNEFYTSTAQNSWGFRATTGASSNSSGLWFTGETAMLLLRDSSGNIITRLSADSSTANNHIGGNPIFHDGYHPNADKWTTARTLSLSGDATGSISWDGSANVTLPVAVVNDSHEHSFNSLLNKTGGTGTYTTSGDFRAPIFYDSNNTAYHVDPNGSSSLTNVYADRYFQRASGIPATNLGDPTVTEMALFDRQFNNKTAFYPAANLKFFTSTDGVTWTEYTSFTDGMKKAFLGGDATSGVFIPNATPYFRIELTNNGNYVYLNALYIYWSASGNSSTVKIQKRRASDDAWLQHTNSSTAVAGWPSHLYLPFAAIPYISPTSTSASHFDTINIDFQPTWANANNIALYNMEVWGGYPAGSRNIYSTDSDKNVTFPTILGANTDIRAPTFYDSNNTGFYFDGAGTSSLYRANGDGFSATQFLCGTLNYGDVSDGSTWYGIGRSTVDGYSVGNKMVQLAGYYGTRIKTNSYIFDIQGSGGVPFSFNGYGQFAGSVRAPIFYDSDNTAFYVDPNSTSNLTGLTVANAITGSVTGNAATATTLQTARTINGVSFNGSANITVADSTKLPLAGGTMTGAITFAGAQTWPTFNQNTTGSAGSLTGFTNSNSATPVNGSDNLTNNGLAYVTGMSLLGQSDGALYAQAYSSSWVHQIYGDYRTGQIALRGKNNGTWQAWRTVLDSSNVGSYAMPSGSSATNSVDVRAPIFYDSNDTAYYTNPNSTSNLLGLSVTNRISGGISGDAQRLFSHTGANNGGLQYWNTLDNTTLNPSAGYHYGLRMGHGDADTYYSATLAVSFFADDFYLRRKTAGTDQTWRRFWHNGDSTISATGDFRAPIFYDSNNTGFYLDPNSTSNLTGLTVANTITGSVSGNAATATNISNSGTVTLASAAESNSIYATNPAYSADQPVKLLNFDWYGNVFSIGNIRSGSTPSAGLGFYYTVSGGSRVELGRFEPTGAFKVGSGVVSYSYQGNGNVGGTGSASWHPSGIYSAGYNWLYGGISAGGGDITAVNEVYANRYYDSGNTGFYGDFASTSRLERLVLSARYDNYFVGSMTTVNAVNNFQTLTNTFGQMNVMQVSDTSGFTNAPTGLYPYGAVMSWRTENHSYQMYASHTGDLAYKTQWDNDNYSGWQTPVIYGRIGSSASGRSIYGSAYYDTDNTGYYVDGAGTSNFVGLTVANTITGSVSGNAATATTLQTARTINGVSFNGSANITIPAVGSVTATAPVVSSGGTTPVISMPAATSSVNGYMTSTYAAKLNGIAAGATANTGTVTGVTGTAPIVSSGGTAPAISMPAATASVNGYMTSTFAAKLNGIAAGATANTGTVTSVSVTTANGVSGTVATSTTTPAITLTLGAITPTSVVASGNITAYSDIRVKANVETISDALDKLDQIRGVTYTRTDLDDKEQRYAGVIAQEIEKVLPEAVRDLGNIKAVDYNATIGLLIQAVKELRDEVETMKSRLH